MKRILIQLKFCITAMVLVFSFTARAQSNNALAFDGINDYVVVPAASALISGSTQLSLTAWVYPTNAAPSFPNFDGFAGFRNNTDADFYLLQYTATSVEARFRGSSGTAHDLVASVLTLNAWNHLAFTYDGAMLRLYKNGILADSLAATDVITNTTENFYIGDQLFQGTHYYLTGKVDEVSLWSRALTAAELPCLPVNGIDTTNATGLQLYYRFNQGIPGGANAGVTTLNDAAGHINGTLTNFALSGGTSNFVTGAASVTTIVGFICPDATYDFNGTIISVPGNYFDTLQNVFGCDSVVQLTLSSLLVDTSVTQNGAILTANHTGVFYQWLDCNNGYAPVPGATQQSFTPSANGSYAVIVSQSGCYDTSSCYSVTNVGLYQPDAAAPLRVFPTASGDVVHIKSQGNTGISGVQLMDVSGRILAEEITGEVPAYDFDISRFAPGNYQLIVTDAAAKHFLFRIVRE